MALSLAITPKSGYGDKVLTFSEVTSLNPAAISGIKVWLSNNSLTGADGAAIATWADSSGNSADFTAAGAARPTVINSQLPSGLRAARFDGTANVLSGTVTASTAWTIAIVARRIAGVDGNERYWNFSTFADLVNGGGAGTYVSQDMVGFYANEALAQLNFANSDALPWFAAIATLTTTEAKVYVDDILMNTFDPADNFATATTIRLGGLVSSNFINADIAQFMMINRVVTAAERVSISRFLLQNVIGKKLVVFDGDSLSDDAETNYPALTMTALGVNYQKSNFAITGQSADTINTNKAAITSRYSPYRPRNILVPWMGTNDIPAGTSAANIIADTTAYCTACRALGYRVVLLNIIKRGGLTAGQEAIRVAVNASLAANYATYATTLVDVAAAPELQDTTDTDYYNADEIHLVAGGQAVVAALVTTAIQALP